MTIGLLEDSDHIREALRRYFELEGWTVREFSRLKPLEDLLTSADSSPDLDLLVMDVMLPDGDGFLLARKVRSRWPSVPFLFLTARTEESDRITGLELGAEDYVVKPFSNREVVLRVKALLRRTGRDLAPDSSAKATSWTLAGQTLGIYPAEKRVLLQGVAVVLTAAEWSILEYLAGKAPQVLSRLQILEHCLHSMAEGSERTIDTHVKNIRHKVGDQDWIETVRGFGYRFAGRKIKE